VTAALARWHRKQGRRVRVFKTGPDFLDPKILEVASGAPVYQLDLWLGGLAHCQALLYAAAEEADLILVEGVMGLFDGEPSSADLAMRFGLPVALVVDTSGMGQTFAAIAHGLTHFNPEIRVHGVLANRVGSANHRQLVAHRTPQFLGALPRTPEAELPRRHLGLVAATEIADIEQRITRMAELIGDTALAELPPSVNFTAPPRAILPTRLQGVRIGVARDEAFSFIYHANLDILSDLGAHLEFFSPLHDARPPDVDALYLPGGYPELHLAKLAANATMKDALRLHHTSGKPIVAECGGMMYLLSETINSDGVVGAMTGLLPGTARMATRLSNLGLHHASLPEGELRGHTFHYSQVEAMPTPAHWSVPQRSTGKAEGVWRDRRLCASYMHWYFPSNPTAIAQLFTP